MSSYVLGFQDVDRADRALVGGKGANLAELSRLDGIRVPAGFCVTTEAYRRVMAAAPALDGLLDRLARLRVEDRAELRKLSGEIRRVVEALAMPDDIRAEISAALARLGAADAYAVRSSATAEDLPGASFAGQQDTVLNVRGTDAILAQIGKCWASLFTERAVIYRMQHAIDHRDVFLAVVVQKMIAAQAAGILFTADPVTANRKVLSIDAGFGLGEALVSGRVNPDTYKVRDGTIVDKRIATKTVALYAVAEGGTLVRELAPAQQTAQVLADAQILALARLGRTIETHFGCPQDIEWCLADDTLSIVQSRPITTLYPIPGAQEDVDDARSDAEPHVYISVAHQQMMTDAMKPLGISVWQLTAARPMFAGGGRLFVDVAPDLASPARRNILVNVLGKSDPLIRDALMTVLAREGFLPPAPAEQPGASPANRTPGPAPASFETLADYDPSIVGELIRRSQSSLDALQREIQRRSGPDLLDFILEDIRQLKQRLADPQSFGVIMTGMNASSWLNETMLAWLGEKNVADTLSHSAPNNITSEMGLALLDVADVIRPFPQVVAYLEQAAGDNVLEELARFEGGPQSRAALAAFLDRYGMRCAGEIDITRPRWREQPGTLIPLILSNIKNFAPGESARRVEQGRQEAAQKEADLLARLALLPDGAQKAGETKRMIDLVRNLIGYREYPKYEIVSRYFLYKQALLREAAKLVAAGVLRDAEDIYYLTLEELHDVVRTHEVDPQRIDRRKAAFHSYEKLVPPRVITSEGEIIRGAYKRDDLPAGALAGLPVSAGTVEGRARVLLRMEEADLAAGDILVTAFTDPSWTPLFVAIAGLVTEVGGLMTHGAVIAREYGLPAVVGVENATRLIQDGQRIRVHGTDGYVEIL